MKIEKYTDFFHDGAIREIRHIKDTVMLSMESAQVLPEWNKGNIVLSKRDTMSGRLFLEGIKNIKENDTLYLEEFKIKDTYDRAGIYDFEIKSNTVSLLIWLVRYPPKIQEETPWFKYEIEAEKIYWENIPTLFDEYWDALEKK